MDVRFPGESAEYRASRERLLEAEIELLRATEQVAVARRELPPGGSVPQDYTFADATSGGPVRLSELFGSGLDTLVVYSLMYSAEAEHPCPSCTSIVDSLDGAAPHLAQRVNLVVVAKSAPERIRAFADDRGWRHVRLLSSVGSTFNHDYLAETSDGFQMPMLNVFVQDGDGIRHFWGSELLYAPEDPGQDGRHVDPIWPIWNVLDLTPTGRGTAPNYPDLSYEPARLTSAHT